MESILAPCLQDIAETIDDFRITPFQSSESVLGRLLDHLGEEPMAGFLASVLPPVDFKAWFSAAEATGGSVADSKSANWPNNRAERVAMQIAFVREIAEKRIQFVGALISYFNAGAHAKIPDHVHLFADRLLVPLHRDIVRLTEQRPIAPVLFETMGRLPSSGDAKLDAMLREACEKFRDPAPTARRDATERLWDAWERLKSLEVAGDKKLSVQTLLDRASGEPKFRKLLEDEARALTNTGNDFQIRHFETSKTAVAGAAEFEYLFHRLYALVHYLLFSRSAAP
ncbi:hypothetical protein [Aquabacterium sp.]|uniref:hypothetical protein n=1 Tax=Aquabacterium sp. TaxID=1872578 RepID=UPI003782FAA9